MHTTAEISKLAESTRPDQFIPVRKEDLFSALIKQGDLADPAQRELFWRFARTLRTICHYEYSETLDRLRDDYYYFNPEVAGHAAVDRAKSEYAYDDLIRSLDKVLKDANFDELPHEDSTGRSQGTAFSPSPYGTAFSERSGSQSVFAGSSPITFTSPSSKAHQKSGPFASPALPRLNAPTTLSDSRQGRRLLRR